MAQQVPAFASSAEALAVARSAMRFVYEDAGRMSIDGQAETLRQLEQLCAVQTAARAAVLSGFTAGQGYLGDADYSARAWLMHRTRISTGAAAGHVGWSRRVAGHPQLGAALAAELISESYARTITRWTDKLPEDCRPAADAILLAAAKSGMDLRDLAELAAEIHARSAPEDEGPDRFEERCVQVETTFGGAGVLRGDLTPECTAVVTTVMDALSAPAGPEDTRTLAQRYHDGLQDAMERLVASGMLPERAGVPVRVWGHIFLPDLMNLDGATELMRQWVTDARAAWAAHRAAASEGGGDGGVWLSGDAAAGMACDGAVAPVVSGSVNPGAFGRMVTLAAELAHLGYLGHTPGSGPGQRGGRGPDDGNGCGPDDGTTSALGSDPGDGAPAVTSGATPQAPGPEVLLRWQALEQAIVEQAVTLLSGPEGLISFVRRTMLGSQLGGPSIPLDVG